MTAYELIKDLGGWEGYRVDFVEHRALDGASEECAVVIGLVCEGGPGVCEECGSVCVRVHEREARWVRELPVFGLACWLHVQRRRLWCEECGGPKLERLSWLVPWARHTTRFAASVARLCKVATHKHVAAEYGIDRKTVKNIDKRHLEASLGPPDLSQVHTLAMDEFAIQKGHRYATVIIDPRRKEVLWVGRGRAREDVRPFFERLGPAGREHIQAVAMDMNAAYAQEVQAQCPNAEIVYDLFHVVAKYGREVVDRVRVDEANRVKDDKRARKVIKSARWLLLRNEENIKRDSDRVRLKELLDANKRLATVYVLKDDLKQLWNFTCPQQAKQFWRQWRNRAMRSTIAPLKAFARKLEGYISGILSHCRYPLHTSILEGINNKIKVIKRMAYGYRDDDYFFLKIRQAFPGNGT